MEIESTCVKTQLFTETLMDGILKVALRENELEYQGESDQFSFFWLILSISSRCKEKNTLFSSQNFSIGRKVSIDNLMDEIQPVVLEKKRFLSRKNWKVFALFLVPKISNERNISQNAVIQGCSTSRELLIWTSIR